MNDKMMYELHGDDPLFGPPGEIYAVENMALQGDVLLRRWDKLPEGAVEEKAEGGRFLIAHSETGHHHYVNVNVDCGLKFFRHPTDPNVCYLSLDSGDVLLQHDRPSDPHSSYSLRAGLWEFRRQLEPNEMAPSGWAAVRD